jgi:hypothetical protein
MSCRIDPCMRVTYAGTMFVDCFTTRRWLLLLAGLPIGAAACASSSEAGTSVSLVSTGTALRAAELVPMGGHGLLQVDELYWTSAEVELTPCRSAWQRAADWLVPEAQAHGDSTPMSMAEPTVENARTTRDVRLGEMRPPAGEYCGLRYVMAPADADAAGLSEARDMFGKSFLLRGALGSEGGPLEPFELSRGDSASVDLPLALELTPDHARASIRFERDLRLGFEGLELEGLSPAERDRALIEAFTASLTIELE